MLVCSVFGDSVGCVEYAASYDTQEIMSLGGFLMWNNYSVYGRRVRLNIYVRFRSDMCKFLDRDSVMIFLLLLCVVSIGMSFY